MSSTEFEHDGTAGVLQQPLARGGVLDDGAARREIAVQDRHRAFRLDRILPRPDRVLTGHLLRVSHDLPQRLALDGLGIEIDEIAELFHQLGHAAGMMEMLHIVLA